MITSTLRRAGLALALGGGLVAAVILGMTLKVALVGNTVCNSSYGEAREAVVHKAVFPDNGSNYCLYSSTRNTIVHVAINSQQLEEWVNRLGESLDRHPVGASFPSLCEKDGWTTMDAWVAAFDHDNFKVFVNYDPHRQIARVHCYH